MAKHSGNAWLLERVFRESVTVKYAWIKQSRDLYSVQRVCEILEVSRTGYQQWLVREPSLKRSRHQQLDARVRALHMASKRTDGRPSLVRALRYEGLNVGHEQVRQSMLRQHLRSVHKRRFVNTTDSTHAKPIAQNVLNQLLTAYGMVQSMSRKGTCWDGNPPFLNSQ
jgi:putative transposase